MAAKKHPATENHRVRRKRGPKKWLTLDSTFGPVEVYLIKDLTDEHGEPVDGLFDPNNYTIQLDAELPPEKALSSLLHEMLHLGFASVRLKQKTLDDNEELFVSFIEPIIFDLLRRNKMLRMP